MRWQPCNRICNSVVKTWENYAIEATHGRPIISFQTAKSRYPKYATQNVTHRRRGLYHRYLIDYLADNLCGVLKLDLKTRGFCKASLHKMQCTAVVHLAPVVSFLSAMHCTVRITIVRAMFAASSSKYRSKLPIVH